MSSAWLATIWAAGREHRGSPYVPSHQVHVSPPGMVHLVHRGSELPGYVEGVRGWL
ncbi:MAG: hypothetical protein WKF47_11455 [Geodermatophilaceae bacterium]